MFNRSVFNGHENKFNKFNAIFSACILQSIIVYNRIIYLYYSLLKMHTYLYVL